MRSLLTTTALALCLGTTAAPAQKMTPLGGAEYWTAYGGTNAAGRLQCSFHTDYQRNNAPGQPAGGMSVIYDSGMPNQLGIQIMKDTWNIPQGTQMRIAMQVDRAPVQVFTAHQWYRPQEVEVEMQLSDTSPTSGQPLITEFLALMASGVNLEVWFPDGNEGAWATNLAGSTAAIQTFSNCIKVIDAKNTQPYQSAPVAQPTQPYSGPPRALPPTQKATQPFTPIAGRIS